MSIRPLVSANGLISIHADGALDVVHDDGLGGLHRGTIPAAQIYFALVPGGGHDHRSIVLTCPAPECNSASVYPVGGGAAPAEIQELFVRLAARIGCPCGLVHAGAPLSLAQAHIKLEAERMDGSARWVAGTVR